MKILTLDNRTYTLEKIPEWVDEKLRFAVLDNSDPANPDFFYIPLIFLESFNAPAAVLEPKTRFLSNRCGRHLHGSQMVLPQD